MQEKFEDSNRTPKRNLARQRSETGKKKMQFLERGKYVAVVADGKLLKYPWARK
jgi:hypothetical protein